ncbi:ABC transporter permease [Microbacterium tumbae]
MNTETIAQRAGASESHRRRPPADFWTALTAPALIFGLLVFLMPIVVIVVRSLTDPGPHNYVDALQSSVFLTSLWVTLRMAFFVAVVCVAVSYPYAWVLSRGPRVIKIILLIALFTSFWTSSLIRTYAWQILLNNTGVINTFLMDLGVISDPLPLIRNDFAVYVGMSQVLAPFAVLTLYTQLNSIKPELELAAQSMGARPVSAFWRVTMPLSLPGAVAAMVLVFIMSIGFYITPAILGSSKSIYVGSLIIQQIEVVLDTGMAATYAIVVLVIVLTILLLAARFVGIGRILGTQRSTR